MDIKEIEIFLKDSLNFVEVYVKGEGLYFNIIVVSDVFVDMSCVKC